MSLMLSPALTAQSLLSRLAWLQQHGASLELFVAYCGSSYVEAALEKLMPPQTLLDTVFLSACSSSAVQLMSGLTSLTFCEILSPHLKSGPPEGAGKPAEALPDKQQLYCSGFTCTPDKLDTGSCQPLEHVSFTF